MRNTTVTGTPQLTDAFAETLRLAGLWRQMKAEEYPEDQRNQRSADALRSLAAWARENAAECEVALGALPPSLTCADLDCLPLGEEASRLLSRYGFDYTEQPRTFLAELAEAAYQDELYAIDVFTTGTRSSLGDPPPGRSRQIGVAASRGAAG
jgi:hypothetical protein